MTDISATATAAELSAQLAEAEAEIERLRAALNKIMRNDPEGYEASIARSALDGK